MFTKSKKGSVFLQGWFVFLLFINIGVQYNLSLYWQNQVSMSFDEAQKSVEEHIKVIQQLRQQAQACTLEKGCESQTMASNRFHYSIQFDLTHYNVVEIIITKP